MHSIPQLSSTLSSSLTSLSLLSTIIPVKTTLLNEILSTLPSLTHLELKETGERDLDELRDVLHDCTPKLESLVVTGLVWYRTFSQPSDSKAPPFLRHLNITARFVPFESGSRFSKPEIWARREIEAWVQVLEWTKECPLESLLLNKATATFDTREVNAEVRKFIDALLESAQSSGSPYRSALKRLTIGGVALDDTLMKEIITSFRNLDRLGFAIAGRDAEELKRLTRILRKAKNLRTLHDFGSASTGTKRLTLERINYIFERLSRLTSLYIGQNPVFWR
ncbi:hypothetical protein DL93DRAFT_2079298, partial [Clavulina sp. PMI_390]